MHQREGAGGAVLSIWQWAATQNLQPKYSGAELHASLRLKDGSLLTIRDWTGFLGKAPRAGC